MATEDRAPAVGRWVLRFGVLALAGIAHPAHATRYPPGPAGTCPDTLTIFRVQNLQATCHPVLGDSVYGLAGIVTAIDQIPTSFGFVIQNNASGANGAPWTGVDISTGSSNRAASLGLALGDSVVVYGKTSDFQGETQIASFNGIMSNPDIITRKVSSGRPIPAVHLGTAAELRDTVGNPNAEPWEGCLVQLDGPLRVARTAATGGLSVNSFIAVDESTCPNGSVGPCDSVYVDEGTLAGGNPTLPPTGAVVDTVRGIYTQRTAGYRIQTRTAADLVLDTPPSLSDAYPVAADTVRVVFDRAVTSASAQNVGNYSLASFGSVLSATLVEPNAVHVKIANGLTVGDAESITVAGIASANGAVMPMPQTRPFVNGILSVADIQAPDPAALAGSPCVDRSRFAGPDSALGARLSFRGIVVKGFGATFLMTDPHAGQKAPARSGVVLFGSNPPLVQGHRYLIAAAVQEFYGETNVVGSAYQRDEGDQSSQIPLPQDQLATNIGAFENATCDSSQSAVTGEDFEGCLVSLSCARIVGGSDPPAGASFRVCGPVGVYSDTMQVVNAGSTYSFDPTPLHFLDVVGLLRYTLGTFRLYPRSDADIVDHGTSGPCALTRIVDVSRDGNDGHDPDMALTSNGSLLAVWGRANDWVAHGSSLDDGFNFARPRLLSVPGRQPAAIMTPVGTVLVAAGSTDSYLTVSRSPDGGRSFRPSPTVVQPLPGSAHPSLAVDYGGGVHLAWDVDTVAVYYAKSTDQGKTFGNPQLLSAPDGAGVTHGRADVAADSATQNVYVVWNHTRNAGAPQERIEFSRSTTGGSSFPAPVTISDPSRLAHDPQVIADPSGAVDVMWVYAGAKDSVVLVESVDAGVTFGRKAAVEIPGDGNGSTRVPSFVRARGGTVYAVVQTDMNGASECLYFSLPFGSSTFTSPLDFTNSSDASLDPVITLDAFGTPVVAWSDIYGGARDILFRRILP